MEDQTLPDEAPSTSGKPGRALKIALVGAGITAGAIGATALGASAATSDSTSTTPAYSSSTQAPGNGSGNGAPQGAPNGAPRDNHGSTPVRSDEKAVTADIAAKLKAAALKAVPGGTVYRVETDSGDAAYEAHMTKADGTEVTVKFDKNYAVTAVEDGMGK